MKSIAGFIIGLICMGIPVPAEGYKQEEKAELGIQLDATWVSKYIWRGQDLYDGHAAFQPSFTYDLFGTGFSAGDILSEDAGRVG
jgi:hypothetical protein